METYNQSWSSNSYSLRRDNALIKVFSRKGVLFFTSVPLYWLIFFRLINFFDMSFFIFVVVSSIMLSLLGKNWGLIEGLISI